MIDGDPVGMLQLAPHPRGLEVCEIQIAKAVQNQGLGSGLLRHIQAQAQSASRAVALDVPKRNDRARRLYERLGFEKTGENDSHDLLLWQPQSD